MRQELSDNRISTFFLPVAVQNSGCMHRILCTVIVNRSKNVDVLRKKY